MGLSQSPKNPKMKIKDVKWHCGGSRMVLRGGLFSCPEHLMTFFSRHTLDISICKLNCSKPVSTTPTSHLMSPQTVHLTKFSPLPTRIASKKISSARGFVRTQRTPLDPPLDVAYNYRMSGQRRRMLEAFVGVQLPLTFLLPSYLYSHSPPWPLLGSRRQRLSFRNGSRQSQATKRHMVHFGLKKVLLARTIFVHVHEIMKIIDCHAEIPLSRNLWGTVSIQFNIS